MATPKKEDKPAPPPDYGQTSYLEMLKTIAKNEAVTEKILFEWANVTPDAEVATALRFVAMREGEHGIAFRKRVLELTGEVLPDPTGNDGRFGTDAMERAGSKSISDKEKFKTLLGRPRKEPNPDKPPPPDIFLSMFDDKMIDPVTGGLLGRFICEERDSADLLDVACAKVLKSEPAPAPAPGGPSLGLVAELERLSNDRMRNAISEEEFKAAKASLLNPASKI